MDSSKSAHSDQGLKSLLTKAWVYKLFQTIVRRKHNKRRLVQEFIQPFAKCRILDIGCGPADIVAYLPDSIDEYLGVDINFKYIEHARQRWRDRATCTFLCQRVDEMPQPQVGAYDIVLAVAIVHHLNDSDARCLFDVAYRSLSSKGVLITYDPVFQENQHWLAKWLISKDRGKSVRTVEGYKMLAAEYFEQIESIVLHDTLKVPYTICLMKCRKE